MSTTALAPSVNSFQIRRIVRRQFRDEMVTLLWALGIGIAVSVGMWAFFGSGLVVTVDGTELFTTRLPVIVGIAFVTLFVHNIVVGSGITRVPIANGATRRNLSIANLLVSAVSALILGVAALAAYLLERQFNREALEGFIGALELDLGPFNVTRAILVGTLAAFALLVSALAIGVVFIRFHWLVGVAVLVFLATVLPWLADRFSWGWYAWMGTWDWPQALVGLVLAGAAYVLMMLRLRVP